MDFIPEDIQKYCEQHSQTSSELLTRIERETHLEVLKPRMLSGHLQGRFLSMISHMIKPSHVLEIGTFTGYSALCLAEGLSEEGQLITIEYNEELIPRIQSYFAQSDVSNRLTVLSGNAREIIPTLTNPWDLVFVDADKDSYQTYFELVLPQVRQGGFILFDNVLWSGKVTDSSANDKKTEMIRQLNRFIHEDPRVVEILLPFRDGLTILRKL